MKIQRKYYIDRYGNCSDGTNMWDWSVDRLTDVINYCWSATISDLAKKIIKRNADRINKILTH
jgi:hypothetical protein